MKRKNAGTTFIEFGAVWIGMYITCIFLLSGLFYFLVITAFSYDWDAPILYQYAIPYIALSLMLMVLGVFQLLVSFYSLRIFPRIWPVYSTIGILVGLGVSLLSFGPQLDIQSPSLRYENPYEFFYSTAALLFAMMGFFQAILLARRYSLRGASGWFLIHIFVAILLQMQKGQFSFFYIPFLFIVLAFATSPLCWYFYRFSRSRHDQPVIKAQS
jgi:hypothetical protein